jgi:tetratricopeptide (TPR) repeat protein
LASKKDKLLESAQKFIAKGQLDKAIREYEQIVALDTSDIRNRQKLAELLVRVNRKDEAVTEYEAIGKYYSKNDFYLKAIATFKQIQKLAPDNINTALTLASLYEKHGLVTNALTEYTLVVNYYQKTDALPDALKVLEMMLAADPGNPNTQLKYAETYFTSGLADKAYREFLRLAVIFRKSADDIAFNKINERVRVLFPDNKDFAIDLAANQIEEGDAAAAISYLRELVNSDKNNLRAWKLLADAYLKVKENSGRKSVLTSIIDIFPDELFAVESLIQAFLDESDTEATLDLLKKYEKNFAQQDALKSLERFYTALREKTTDDIRVLHGLKHLYEALDENEKLASINAVMETLGTATDEEPVQSYAEEAPDAQEGPVAAAPMEETAGEMEWEEEIDLSLADDGGIGDIHDDFEKEEVPPLDTTESLDTKSVKSPAESEDFTEIDLEPGETGINLNEWLREYEKAESEIIPPPAEDTLQEKDDAIIAKKRKKYDLDGQFSEFKKGVDQQLDKDDTETHYNLGIAYKEMGLLDDAVSEFQIAAMDPHRKIDCMTLQGICYRDKGDVAKAEDIFNHALSQNELNSEERLSLNYELAFLCENVGRQSDALRLYRQVRAINPGFRDATKKIAHLIGSEEPDDMELLELDVEEFEK